MPININTNLTVHGDSSDLTKCGALDAVLDISEVMHCTRYARYTILAYMSPYSVLVCFDSDRSGSVSRGELSEQAVVSMPDVASTL